MLKRLKKTVNSIPTIIKLIRSKTPDKGKDIAKSGFTSLVIAGSISAGKLQFSEIDTTLLIILGIIEAFGYLYGGIAVSIGTTQSE